MSEMTQPLLSESNAASSDDEESQMTKPEDEVIHATKGVFIYRLYSILSIQLAVGIAMNVALTTSQAATKFISESTLTLLVSFALMIVLILVLIYAKGMARKQPFNYILLIVFTLDEAFIIAQLCVAINPYAFLIGLIMALTVTVSLLTYSMYAGDSFTSSLGLPTAIFSTVIVFAVCMRISYDTSPFDVVLST
jgi:FtsH-binding integral membrane protein